MTTIKKTSAKPKKPGEKVANETRAAFALFAPSLPVVTPECRRGPRGAFALRAHGPPRQPGTCA